MWIEYIQYINSDKFLPILFWSQEKFLRLCNVRMRGTAGRGMRDSRQGYEGQQIEIRGIVNRDKRDNR
jgi:hypothetical protein